MAIAFTYLRDWSNTDHANVVATTGGVYNLEDASLRPGARVTIINLDHTTAVTVTPVSGQLIGNAVGGAATYALAAPSTGANTAVTLLADKGSWLIVSSH
jgi:hypothetical protein